MHHLQVIEGLGVDTRVVAGVDTGGHPAGGIETAAVYVGVDGAAWSVSTPGGQGRQSPRGTGSTLRRQVSTPGEGGEVDTSRHGVDGRRCRCRPVATVSTRPVDT